MGVTDTDFISSLQGMEGDYKHLEFGILDRYGLDAGYIVTRTPSTAPRSLKKGDGEGRHSREANTFLTALTSNPESPELSLASSHPIPRHEASRAEGIQSCRTMR